MINFTGKVIGYDGSTIEEILKDYYTKAETYSKKETYSKEETYSKGETYSKEETDSIIPKFSGFIQGEIRLVTQTPADKRGEVMYSSTLGRFVYKLGDTYYSSWFSIHHYMVIDTMRPIESRILLTFCVTLTILCSTRRANWPSLGKGRRPQEKASAFASIQSAAHRRGTLSMIPAPRAAALAPHEASGTNR